MPSSVNMDSFPPDQAEDGEGKPFSEVQARQMISKISREELEDKFLRLQEDNTDLKKYARKQEEKIKKMATKLLRLVADKKKREAMQGGPSGKDVELEEKMADLHEKIMQLEKQNSGLKSKLALAKQQLQTQGKRTTPYDHVKPRINTGVHARSPSGNRLKKNLRVQGQDLRPGSRVPPAPTPVLAQPRYGHSLLEEARLEKRELEDFISQLQDEIQLLEEDKRLLQLQMEDKEHEHEEELALAREQLTGVQRSNLQENVDMIKVQRDVKDKSTKLQALQAKYTTLDENLHKVKKSHTQLLEEMEKLNTKLKEEQTKNMMLANELKTSGLSSKSMAEQVQLISDLKAENEILKEANEKLVNSAFDVGRERQHRSKQRNLEVELEQLRATINSDLLEKNEILDKLAAERENAEKEHKELSELRIQHYTLKEQYDTLKEKMTFFTRESSVDFHEIEEALMLIKQRKEKGSQDLDFLEKVDDELEKDLKKHHTELQASHADTINELEKTRNMLIIQHKINKDYKTEVDRVTKKMIEDKKEYDLKMQEFAQLLDIRADRIRKLEAQMRDIAYGTKRYKAVASEESEYDEMDSTLELERGQNIFEIHIDKVSLTEASSAEFGDAEPVFFVTYEFFEHELQSTPVMRGSSARFDFTSQYLVQVDDFFLHFLQKESTLVELHRAFGTDYKTIGACQLKFRELLEKSHGRLHGTVKLIGTGPPCEGVDIAVMEYWIRLRVPMDQAIRLFRERTKALGYMGSSDYTALEDAGHPQKAPSDVNELDIHVIKCSSVKPKQEGIQPSPYCVYKFYDFGDHDTRIIHNSNEPVFNDVKTFTVPMTEDLDSYLRSKMLEIFVFDDVDPDMNSYLGVAKVSMISLANDKPLKGTFEIRKPNGETNGSMDVWLKWRYTYLPASAKPRRSQPRLMAVPKDGEEYPEYAMGVAEGRVGQVTSVDSIHSKPPIGSSTPKRVDSGISKEEVDLKPMPLKRKKEIAESKDEKKQQRPRHEKPVEDSEPVEAEKPKPIPRARKPSHTIEAIEKEKPIEEMDVDEMIKAVSEPPPPAKQERHEFDSESEIDEEINEEEEEEGEGEADEESDETRVVEEMRRTAERDGEEDTLFEDQRSDADSSLGEEVDLPVPSNQQEESGAETSESEGLVVTPSPSRVASVMPSSQTITIQITSLTLEESPVLQNKAIKQLFVSYSFLDCDPAELETPMSLQKPKSPDKPIYYNFKKVFHVDAETNPVKRNHLKYMLTPENPTEGRVMFTVVSEPSDPEDGDCMDVAYAYVDLLKILQDGKDVIDQDLDLIDMTGENGEIGSLTVTVVAFEALRSLYDDDDDDE